MIAPGVLSAEGGNPGYRIGGTFNPEGVEELPNPMKNEHPL